MVLMDVWKARVEERKEMYTAAPNGCVFIEGTRLGKRAIRGLLSPVADLPEGTNKYGQGSPDLELSGCAQKLHLVPHLQLSCFEVLEHVGTGGFGQVRLAKFKGDKGSAPVAIKEVKDDAQACITLEANLHSRLSHSRIVPVLAVLPSRENKEVISGLVTSYCEGGSLGEWLDLRRSRRVKDYNNRSSCPDPTASLVVQQAHERSSHILPWSQRLRIAEHVLEALAYMHARDVCHLDIKPGNLLMRNCHPDTDADIMICDFGLARSVDGSFMPGRYRGTWPYMPPEMVVSNQTRAHPALDIWSLGVVLLDLVSDHPVGHGQTPDEIKQALRSCSLYTDLENEVGVYCEPEWIQLLELCLQYDPARRTSACMLLEYVRAQRALCAHREKMRCMHAAVLRGVPTGAMRTATASTAVRSRDGAVRVGRGQRARGLHGDGIDGSRVSGGSGGTYMRGLRLPEELLSNGEAARTRAQQLNLPDSLDLHAVAPAPVKLNRGSASGSRSRSRSRERNCTEDAASEEASSADGNRCAELNLPESLELYTARASAAELRALAWDAASGSAARTASGTASGSASDEAGTSSRLS